MSDPLNDLVENSDLREQSLRVMCRRLAAALVRAMADTDTSLEDIAIRTGHSKDRVRRFIKALIDGKSQQNGLDMMSDFAGAMGCEVEFTVRRPESSAPRPPALRWGAW